MSATSEAISVYLYWPLPGCVGLPKIGLRKQDFTVACRGSMLKLLHITPDLWLANKYGSRIIWVWKMLGYLSPKAMTRGQIHQNLATTYFLPLKTEY